MKEDAETILGKLNPADKFTLAMDEEIRRDGLPGSYGCLALELGSSPDITTLQQRITEFSQRFPVVLASLRAIGRHFYWCKRTSAPSLFFHQQCPAREDENDFLPRAINQIINEQQPRHQIPPITFHLLSATHRHLFLIRWIHPLCDARGAELILKYLCTDDAAQRRQFGEPAIASLVNAQLDKFHWWQKIHLLWKGKRYIDRLDSLSSIQAFAQDLPPQRLNYCIKTLSEEQTRQIMQQSRQLVGLTGDSLYYIGSLMRAMEALYADHPGQAYCVPYAFNLRKQRALTPMTGNHICALFAQAPRDIVQDRQRLLIYLKQQNSDVIRQQLDYAFLPLMWAGSWLSLAEYGKTLRLSYGSGTERSSFWFSNIGQLNFSPNHFPGAEIVGFYPVCQVSTPPSLAFLTCIFHNRLTLSYNFVEPAVTAEAIERLHQKVLAELLGDVD